MRGTVAKRLRRILKPFKAIPTELRAKINSNGTATAINTGYRAVYQHTKKELRK